MEILINDQKQIVAAGTTVSQIITEVLSIETSGTAIAINDKIIPKSNWDTVQLNESDKLLIIKASKGG